MSERGEIVHRYMKVNPLLINSFKNIDPGKIRLMSFFSCLPLLFRSLSHGIICNDICLCQLPHVLSRIRWDLTEFLVQRANLDSFFEGEDDKLV